MASTLNELGKRAFSDIAAGISPTHLEQFKLERLLELRAVIDALRSERGHGHQGAGPSISPRFRQ